MDIQMTDMDKKDLISLIIPCYNEEKSIPFLKEALEKLMADMPEVSFEVLMIDNCSEDATLRMMKELHESDSVFNYISFSRNFGKDASMYAGLRESRGDYVAVLDADLQDPPELVKEMYATLKTGEYDCVATRRGDRAGEPWLRSVLAKMFYGLMGKISDYEIVDGARDFRLMTRQMVDSVLSLEESERFSKGIFSWVGFRTKWISFSNRERVAGQTKLPMKSAFSYAVRGIVAFSTFPLVLASGIGMFTFFAAIIYTIVVVIKQLVTHEAVLGYSSMMCVILFGFGISFMILGVIGQYLAQMYLEIKKRPKYIVRESSLTETDDSVNKKKKRKKKNEKKKEKKKRKKREEQKAQRKEEQNDETEDSAEYNKSENESKNGKDDGGITSETESIKE